MKWILLFGYLTTIFPLSRWLRRHPDQSPKIWMLLGFLPFILSYFHLFMAIDSWAAWPGYVKGLEFSVLDGVALALYLSLPGWHYRLPFRISMVLYFIAVLLSAFQAAVPEAALFYPWQLGRMFLIYAVVARGCADRRVVLALVNGMAAGIVAEAAFTIFQRLSLGELQAVGTVGQQNLLGVMSHFAIFAVFALLLAGQRGWLLPVAALAGVVLEVLTASRATVGFASLGYAAVFTLSALRQWTPRKASILFAGIVITAVFAPFAIFSIQQRGEADLKGSTQERYIFEAAAAAILSDHPWGVGANHYVITANLGGYNQRAGVSSTSSTATVHNVYWLVADETGYFGLITFVVFLLRPLTVAFLCGWRNRGDQRADLLLGLGVSLLVVYIHSMFEWVLVIFQPQYLFAMDVGLVAGLAQQLGYWRRPHPKNAPLRGANLSIGTTRASQ